METETKQNQKEATLKVKALAEECGENLQRCFSILKSAMQEIQKKNSPADELDELHRSTFALVLHGQGERLYNVTKEVVSNHVESKIKPQVVNSKESTFLETLQEAWKEHQVAMSKIGYFLLYMDLHYVQQNGLQNLCALGIRTFRDKVYNVIRDRLEKVLLDIAEKERVGENVDRVDRVNFKNACGMLLSLGIGTRSVYEAGFEKSFLQKAAQVYKGKSQILLEENSASAYVEKVEEIIQEDTEKSKNYLEADTQSAFINVAEDEMIRKPMKTVVEMENSGAIYMVKNELTDELNSMFKLFSRVPVGRETIENCIARYHEEIKRQQQIEEARRQKEIEEEARRQKEIEEARRQKEIEEEMKRQEIEKIRRQKEIEEEIRRQEIEEAKKQKEIEETRKQQLIEDAKRQKEVEEAKMLKLIEAINKPLLKRESMKQVLVDAPEKQLIETPQKNVSSKIADSIGNSKFLSETMSTSKKDQRKRTEDVEKKRQQKA